MQPYDYASILQAGQNLVPDTVLRDVQLNQMRAQQAQVQQQVQASQKAQQDERSFQSDLDGYLMAPTPQATSALLLKHPKFAATIKQSYELQDAETRRMDMGQKVSIYSAARAGNYDLAAKTLETRIASERAAGRDVADDEAALAAMRSENPQERGAVLGMLQLDLAASDPERFAATFKALNEAESPNLRSVNAGDVIIDERTGKEVYTSPYKPQLVQIRNADGSTSVVEYTQGGGDPVSTGAPSAGGLSVPFSKIVQIEGGTGKNGQFLTSPKGAVGPAQVMPKTAPEAARLAGVPFEEQKYRTDPEYNLKLGNAYYGEMQRQFGNDVYAAAAYNAGPGRMRAALKKGGAGGFEKFLPPETQDYLVKTGAAKRLADGNLYYSIGGKWFDNPEGK